MRNNHICSPLCFLHDTTENVALASRNSCDRRAYRDMNNYQLIVTTRKKISPSWSAISSSKTSGGNVAMTSCVISPCPRRIMVTATSGCGVNPLKGEHHKFRTDLRYVLTDMLFTQPPQCGRRMIWREVVLGDHQMGRRAGPILQNARWERITGLPSRKNSGITYQLSSQPS